MELGDFKDVDANGGMAVGDIGRGRLFRLENDISCRYGNGKPIEHQSVHGEELDDSAIA
jgi:hypothetical protein